MEGPTVTRDNAQSLHVCLTALCQAFTSCKPRRGKACRPRRRCGVDSGRHGCSTARPDTSGVRSLWFEVLHEDVLSQARTTQTPGAMDMVLVLECVARFLFRETNLHVDLVPLLPVCRALAPWSTALQAWLDNTLRVVARFQEAFAVGRCTVTFLARTGPRGAHAPSRAPFAH